MSQQPLFWYRPRSDGGYEGPLHNGQIEDIRKASGAWVPLFAGAAPVNAEPSDDEIIDIAVEPLGIDCDRMPYGIVVFARALLSRYSSAPIAAQPDVTQQTLDDVMAGIPARDAEIEALRKEVEALQADQAQPSGDRAMLESLMRSFDMEVWNCPNCTATEETKDCDSAIMLREYLANNPVPAKAQQPVSGADGLPKGAMQFTKKPVTVSAIQWTGDNPDEVQAFLFNGHKHAADGWVKGQYVEIGTLEGLMVASIGDWIIRGVKGEHYPCKPDIFAATYEPAQPQPSVSSGEFEKFAGRKLMEAYKAGMHGKNFNIPETVDSITRASMDQFRDTAQMIEPSGISGELPELSIQWHDTPEAVHRLFWEKAALENSMTYEELIEGAMVGETEHREKVELTYEQEIQAIRDQKCWGCADTETNQIHVWAAPDVDRTLLIHMLAHEIGHLTGEPHTDDIQEELRAETFGKVAAMAYQMLQAQQDADKVDVALAEMVHAMFRSGNSVPVTRIMIDRKQYESAIDAAPKEPDQ
ncbi:hypothetical protein [Alcaligenes ammonioxydans]|uniref:hypothetical protein n=1 Tax=Alcaligenes ammonioxydans TaxID=2582914 RepID=UPI003D22DDDD